MEKGVGGTSRAVSACYSVHFDVSEYNINVPDLIMIAQNDVLMWIQ